MDDKAEEFMMIIATKDISPSQTITILQEMIKVLVKEEEK